ncbi:unnamed protein product, partial [Gulo gulo]
GRRPGPRAIAGSRGPARPARRPFPPVSLPAARPQILSCPGDGLHLGPVGRRLYLAAEVTRKPEEVLGSGSRGAAPGFTGSKGGAAKARMMSGSNNCCLS